MHATPGGFILYRCQAADCPRRKSTSHQGTLAAHSPVFAPLYSQQTLANLRVRLFRSLIHADYEGRWVISYFMEFLGNFSCIQFIFDSIDCEIVGRVKFHSDN